MNVALEIFVSAFAIFLFISSPVSSSPYDPELTSYNLNVNQTATDPTDYYTTRANQTYTPSPVNWRALPLYTILLDKYANGDPANDNFFGTMYESDVRETQLRFGGDLKGLVGRLDYLQGMGVRVIYISGTPFLNMIWEADSKHPSPDFSNGAITYLVGYSPLDFSVLDPHWGTWDDWVETIDEIHARGMYLMSDLTIGTMSSLIGFEG